MSKPICGSSDDVAVVVDFHWFTDCHLEAIFNMNTSRLQLRSTITVDELQLWLAVVMVMNMI